MYRRQAQRWDVYCGQAQRWDPQASVAVGCGCRNGIYRRTRTAVGWSLGLSAPMRVAKRISNRNTVRSHRPCYRAAFTLMLLLIKTRHYRSMAPAHSKTGICDVAMPGICYIPSIGELSAQVKGTPIGFHLHPTAPPNRPGTPQTNI